MSNELVLLEEKIKKVNIGLKEFIPNREAWLRSKLYDELHMQRWLLAILLDGVPQGQIRLLDAGAGYGGFAIVATWYGFRVTALEPNPLLAEIIELRAKRFNVDIDVICKKAEEYHPRLPFQLVTTWNALEHIDEPKSFLARISNWLSPGGRIYLNVMNRFSLVDPHLHLYFVNFLPQSVRMFYSRLRRSGSNAIGPFAMSFELLHYFTPSRFEKLAYSAGYKYVRLRSGRILKDLFGPSFLYRLNKHA